MRWLLVGVGSQGDQNPISLRLPHEVERIYVSAVIHDDSQRLQAVSSSRRHDQGRSRWINGLHVKDTVLNVSHCQDLFRDLVTSDDPEAVGSNLYPFGFEGFLCSGDLVRRHLAVVELLLEAVLGDFQECQQRTPGIDAPFSQDGSLVEVR